MEIAMIGIGRMGANMAQRLLRAGHTVVGYARTAATVQKRVDEGAITEGATSLEDVVHKLKQSPRVIWLMIPAASVDDTIQQLIPHLSPNDIIVDAGNSNYQDDIRRTAELKKYNIRYADSGTSGGVWGLERGYCQMSALRAVRN
jgi:6-phosphogluconate dehydrogenase